MSTADVQRTIYVYADWASLAGPTLMGTLTATRVKGREVFSFAYDEDWIRSAHVQVLDPDLQLYAGPQYLREESKPNFGLFTDSSPDRWGRTLMSRREAFEARQEERKPRKLFETDFLLGVYDAHRMGALRFKEDPDGPFLSDHKGMATPPETSLRELEQASWELENEEGGNEQLGQWLRLLVAPGSSLGGARPKASVLGGDGSLWMAKFPSRNDAVDIGAWEAVVHRLAEEAGIRVPPVRLGRYNHRHHTFLSQRFDRTSDGRRLHFASAMTLLGQKDGADAGQGMSYLHLAELIIRHGRQVNHELEELWRRIIFNICVKNTDDHLRNHGFLLHEGAWVLSPAYDMNPAPFGEGLTLNITLEDNALDLDLARSVSGEFRLTTARAASIIEAVQQVVKTWRHVAMEVGINRGEQERMAPAFD